METINDIVNDMREHSGEMTPPQIIFNEDGGVDMSILADRIEKAVTKCNQLKMREALDKLLGVFNSGLVEYSNWCNKSDIAQIQYVIDKAGEVISAPPRNCDVGTAEEQEKRFLEFCKFKCRYCECSGGNNTHCCALRWAQMPYK